MAFTSHRITHHRQCACTKQRRSHTQRVLCNASTPSSASHTTATRRDLAIWSIASVILFGSQTDDAQASGRGSVLRKKVPIENYTVSGLNGLKMCDLLEGKGPAIEEGSTIVVHWDVLYRGINVVSSRLARTLGGNRTVAEPFEFVVGESVAFSSAAGGPQPPSALSRSVIGMKDGGIRSILVDNPKLGYPKRMQEIPPGEDFELRVEVLDIKSI